MKYIIIGGIPVITHTGTITFPGLEVVGKTNSEKEMKQIVEEKYSACGGLLLVIDSNGNVVTI